MKSIREGLTPTLLGTVVTGVSLATMPTMKDKKTKMITAGVLGFGLAHIALGSIDLIQGRQIKI